MSIKHEWLTPVYLGPTAAAVGESVYRGSGLWIKNTSNKILVTTPALW